MKSSLLELYKKKYGSGGKTPIRKTGMWYQDGDVVVPSNQITMKGPQGQPDYFKSPIMGTGMQSGQTQVMYPGREYSFPNDNSVYETKMQSGGINLTEEISSLNPNYRKSNFKNILNTADIVTDAMQMGHFIPHPIGQAVGYIGDALGAGIDIAQSGINIAEGDYKGAVTNAALGILPGVTGKQGYKRANSLMTGKGSGMYRPLQALPNLKNNPVIQKGLMWNKTTLGANAAEIGSNLNFNNNKDTIFGGYQDNTQLAPTVRPVKPKMQSGGLFPVGPYDEMMAPKQGNYLLPDINRPSYVDDYGGRRSEYRMGINIDGKETLIPTVVGGRQLTEDQAINQYMKTGLHMGQFDTPEQSDYASRSRTAKYSMFEDPIRFTSNQFQMGGMAIPGVNGTVVSSTSIRDTYKKKKKK